MHIPSESYSLPNLDNKVPENTVQRLAKQKIKNCHVADLSAWDSMVAVFFLGEGRPVLIEISPIA